MEVINDIIDAIHQDSVDKFILFLEDESELIRFTYLSVEVGAINILKYILSNFTVINKYLNMMRESLISMAVYSENIEIIELLIENGEDINGNPLSLHNPLNLSIIRSKRKVFDFLITKNVDVNFYLPRSNRTVLDNAFFYEKYENYDIAEIETKLKEKGAVATKTNYENYSYDVTRFYFLIEMFGKLINYKFDFKEFSSSIYIGFYDKCNNYLFSENKDAIFMVFLTEDWPLNNLNRYLDTDYSFFFKVLNKMAENEIPFDYFDENDEINMDFFKGFSHPKNISRFQIIDLELEDNHTGKKIYILSPIDQRKKKFEADLSQKDILRMCYQWPENKRGPKVSEDIFSENN